MDSLSQIWQEIVARPSGPMAMRFYLQPTMAAIFAIRDGLKDARNGKPAYFWALFTDPEHRAERFRDGWKSVGKIFIIASILDIVYQLVELHTIRPVQTLFVATLLALVPYICLRGPINRLARRAGARRRPDTSKAA